ncbi:DUF1194 domain-containing protein [Undibacter mobilis]|uniref:DUF1194 domain-containing protein n=1 Tax=Undibacter mobilis TaxID=2292256 RepID=A0A371BAL0_9BRAD|nr:DUF1194 domain-containing protein [Undibacter mobilis]RDV04618.1 DUF1194 domain-containing protein [Undibacter mobilis]
MSRLFRCALLLVAAFAISNLIVPARAAEKVDLLLVLASDVSRSVTGDKFKLQRDGYAAAIANPKVLEAIKGGRNGRIAVMFIEWSGAANQKVVIGWTVIDGPQTAHAFGTRLLEEPRAFADRTSISGGIDVAMAELAKAPYFSERQTIDVSGDGTNNSGRDVRQVRDEAIAKGIVINGLVILSDQPMPWNPEHTHPPGGLAKYYRDNVTGGPGSFVMEARDFESFGDAILKKMIAEIADASRELGAPIAR